MTEKTISKRELRKKEIAYLSKDIEDKCEIIGHVSMYELYPKARYGSDTAIVAKCIAKNIKRETISPGQSDILVALTSKHTREKLFPHAKKIEL